MSILEHFSKRTLILIAVLLFITVLLLYLALREENTTPTKNIPTPAVKVSSAHSVLSLSELSATDTAHFGTGIAVNINSQSNVVSGVQFEIAYDPEVISNVKVTQGTFFTNPIVLINSVDQTNGRIFYAIAISPTGKPVKGTGQAAIITYSLLSAQKKSTTFTFLPKTVVTQEGILDSVLEKTVNITIPLGVNPGGLNIPATGIAK